MSLPQSQKNLLIQKESVTFDQFQKVYDQLMRRTWIVNNIAYNLADEGWGWGFDNAKKSIGVCYFNRWNPSRNRIAISRPLFSANKDTMAKEFEDTVRHEIAHAIDYTIRRASDHGIVWKLIAIQVGAHPTANKSLDNSVPKKWRATCTECGGEVSRHRLTKEARLYSACSRCCRAHNGGNFDVKYQYVWSKQF